MSVNVATSRWRSVAWKHVAQFYAIAFGGAVVVGLGLVGLSRVLPPSLQMLTSVVTAVLYMPLPIVAGLIVERLHGRHYLIAELRHGFWRAYGRSAGYAISMMVVILALGFAVAWAAGAAGLPGAGHLVSSDAELRQRLMEITPGVTATTPLPSAAMLAIPGLIQGLIAGLTINALFAFGEEYGWRGVLAEQLRPLGVLRANLVIGVLWGLWHAPIIIGMGHNYGRDWAWGVPMMVAWTVPLGFLLAWVRARAKSVLAPAILHGAYNGTIGMFVILIVGGNLFIALPMGWLMVAVLTVLAIIAWRFPPKPMVAEP